jgi:hypothetical protein
MIRFIARRVAKLQYIWKLEIEGHTNEVNAQLAANRAQEKRAYIGQLNREADDIEKNITEYALKEQLGYYVCDNGHEAKFNGDVHAESQRCAECKQYPMKLIKRDLMTGQEKYESDKERDEAKTIATEKRKAAEAEATNVTEGEKTAEYFRGMANNSRIVADKIRHIE